MKILLINSPKLGKEGVISQLYPPLGLLYLASYIREKENDVELKVIDGHKTNYNILLSQAASFSPDIIGISFSTQSSTGAYRLINDVQNKIIGNTKPLIVCGGPHPTALPEEVLYNSSCDVVVIGEGEITFHEMVMTIKNKSRDFSDILGIGYLENRKVNITPKRPLIKNLDSLPFPARDLIDLSLYPGLYYKKEKTETYLISSRGCPYNCVYCSNPVWKNNKPWYRLRSPKNVVDEIEYIVNKLGIREIYDQTDEFNGNLQWAKDVCDEIVKRGIKVSLKAQMRTDNMDKELAVKMRAAGYWLGLFGIESGNEKTLKGIQKRTTIKEHKHALSLLKKAGLKTFALLMAFNVWEEKGSLCFENKAQTLNTLAYAKKLAKERKIDIMSWSLTTPYPGSKLYEIAQKHRLISEKLFGRWELWDPSERMIMKLPGVSYKDWVEIQNKGKILQAILLIRSGTFNLKSFPQYTKRAYSQVLKYFKSKLGKNNS